MAAVTSGDSCWRSERDQLGDGIEANAHARPDEASRSVAGYHRRLVFEEGVPTFEEIGKVRCEIDRIRGESYWERDEMRKLERDMKQQNM